MYNRNWQTNWLVLNCCYIYQYYSNKCVLQKKEKNKRMKQCCKLKMMLFCVCLFVRVCGLFQLKRWKKKQIKNDSNWKVKKNKSNFNSPIMKWLCSVCSVNKCVCVTCYKVGIPSDRNQIGSVLIVDELVRVAHAVGSNLNRIELWVQWKSISIMRWFDQSLIHLMANVYKCVWNANIFFIRSYSISIKYFHLPGFQARRTCEKEKMRKKKI